MDTPFAHKYRLKDQLGQGGFAAVYRAVDTTLDREVAIKLLDQRLQQDETFIRRFRREAKTVASLQHPHIIQVYEIGEYQGQHFIVMPYLAGPTLVELIRQSGALPLHRVGQLAAQIGSALDYAHQHGLIHRDIKPANVILDQGGQAILTDFGIVKVIGESTLLTQTGATIGTPPYMAPEQWTAKEVDHRTDLYSFAIVVYQMLTGQVPFQGQTPHQMMYQHLEVRPPAPQTLNQQVPAQLEAVFEKALAKQPDQRYQRAEQFVEAVQRATLGATTPASGVRWPTPAPPPASSTKPASSTSQPLPWLLVAGGGVLAVMLLIGGWLLWGGSASPTVDPTATISVAVVESQETPTADAPSATFSPVPATATPESVITRAADTLPAGEPSPPASEVINEPPTLLEPAEGSQLPADQAEPLTLEWSGRELADNERFAIVMRNDQQQVFPAQGDDKWTTTESTFTVPQVLPAGEYTWLVIVEQEQAGQYRELNRATGNFTIMAPAAQPTATPRPVSSPTAPPAALATATPTRISATATPTIDADSVTLASIDLSNLQLISPLSNPVFSHQDNTFQWRWSGELPPGYQFEVRIWLDDETHYGAYDIRYVPLQRNGDIYSVTFKPEGAQSVDLHGTRENYQWAVGVVQVEPYKRIDGLESAPQRINISLPGPSGGGGGGSSGGGGEGGDAGTR